MSQDDWEKDEKTVKNDKKDLGVYVNVPIFHVCFVF